MMTAFLRRHGAWLAVALAAIAVYANSLFNGYALDDVFIIQTNTRVHQLTEQSLIWLKPYWPFFGRELGLYRPFVIFAYALEWAVSGGAAWVFHLFSLLLHATASVLAFFLLRKLAGETPALLGGLLFAVHPVHTEAVANIVGQAELIAGVTTFAACLLYATRPEGTTTSWPRRLALLALYAIGMLTKESAIVLPGLLVALDFTQKRVQLSRAGCARYVSDVFVPMFLLVAVAISYLTLRVDVLGSIGGVDAAPSLPFLKQAPRVPTALRSWPEFVRLLFYPADLSSDYSPGVVLPVEGITPMALLGAAVMILTALLALLTPLYPAAGLAAAWFFISVLPVSNLLMPIGVLLAERLLYTPSFAASLIVAFAARALLAARTASLPRPRMMPAIALAALVLITLSYRTWIRNPDWKSTAAVLEAIVRDHPESYRAHWSSGGAAMTSGNFKLALQYFELAYRIWPHDPQLLDDIANAYMATGQYEKAIPLLERSRDALGWLSRTHFMLATAYIVTNRFDAALNSTTQATRLGMSGDMLFPVYGQAYEGLDRDPEAIGAWRAALRQPYSDQWTYRARLARLYARTGSLEAATAQADSAAARVPPQDTANLRLMHTLRHAIVQNCYSKLPQSSAVRRGCEDPIAHWQVLVPHRTMQFAKDSQTASGMVELEPSEARAR
jgi:tetratricopeptide (TPR) repeat protein